MGGLQTGVPERDNGTQNIQYIKKAFTYLDAGTTIDIGTIPEGAIILKPISGVHVITAFNGDTTNTLDIGPSTNTDLWGTDLALGTVGFIPIDEAVSNVVGSGESAVQAAVVSPASASAGSAIVVIAYIVN